jgi:hypothetical protein
MNWQNLAWELLLKYLIKGKKEGRIEVTQR